MFKTAFVSALVMASGLIGLNASGSTTGTGASQDQFNILCRSRVSSLQLFTQDDLVYLRFSDGIGFQNFPIFNGSVTPMILPYIQRASEDLKTIDGSLVAVFHRSQCQFDPARPLLVMCNGLGKLEAPEDTQLQANGLSSDLETVERLDLSFSRLNFSIGIDTPQPSFRHYFIKLPFNSADCRKL